MNIVLFSRAIYGLHGYGGMERHCQDWILSLAELGCRIHVVTMPPSAANGLSGYPKEVTFYFVPGVPARTVIRRLTSYPQWIAEAGRLIQKLEKEIPLQAIYAHGLAVAGCGSLRTPVYHNPHGMEEFKTRGLKHLAYAPFRTLVRRAAKNAQKVIATDRSLIAEITRYLRVPESKVELLPNALRDLPQETKHASQDFVFLAAGRLEPNKGFHVLLEALSKAKLPQEWKLHIVGDGSQLQPLKDLSRSRNLQDKIEFHGAISEKEFESLFSSARLFVHPPLYEGSSIVTLQAMSYSLPVIASQTGGLPDKVIPGWNGWLFPPGDAIALASALEEACEHREQWNQMGQNGRKIIIERYLWRTVAERFLEMFAASVEQR